VNLPDGATSVDVASMPRAMTQNEPLDVEDFIKEAQKRGVHLRPASLRELYRHRLLIHTVRPGHHPHNKQPSRAGHAESPFGGTRITDLRQAHDTGRLRDPAALPYQLAGLPGRGPAAGRSRTCRQAGQDAGAVRPGAVAACG
jgi:hypothetical protein